LGRREKVLTLGIKRCGERGMGERYEPKGSMFRKYWDCEEKNEGGGFSTRKQWRGLYQTYKIGGPKNGAW